ADAGVHALLLVVEQGAAEGPLRPLAAGDPQLRRRELPPPFLVRLDHPGYLDRPHQLSLAVEHLDLHGCLLTSFVRQSPLPLYALPVSPLRRRPGLLQVELDQSSV